MEDRISFNHLLELHLTMQLGCYFSGIDVGPDGERYAWAGKIPDSSWNAAVGLDHYSPSQLEWVLSAAARHDRTAAVFVSNSLAASQLQKNTNLSAVPERWMLLPMPPRTEQLPSESLSGVSVSTLAAPSADFCEIFSHLFQDASLNDHFAQYYIPTLRNAHEVEGGRQYHFVLHDKGTPVSCASIYMIGSAACLYNVGTVAARQGNGFGRLMSRIAIDHAFTQGASFIFLQCECDGHVERMYKSLGFQPSFTPVTLSYSNADSR